LRIGDWAGGSETLEKTTRDFLSILSSAAERTSEEQLICLCPESKRSLADPVVSDVIGNAQDILTKGLATIPHATLCLGTEVSRRYAVQELHDDGSDRLGAIPYTAEFYAALATTIFRKIAALRRAPLKAIACDCDNTLWKGIVAEDGVDRLIIDAGHRQLYDILSRQKDSGVLLCLCSKNAMGDVVKAFETRDDIALRWKDFAATRINWLPKPENLRSMSDELQLGLDSFAFIDDDPLECDEMSSRCPEVLTLQLPQSPIAERFWDHLWVFDSAGLTQESARRTQLYLEEKDRRAHSRSFASLSEYIEQLQLQVGISSLFLDQLPRAVELLHRTNQFNTTCLKFSVQELRSLLESGQLEGRTYNVSDRYGDYGLVGLVLFTQSDVDFTVEAMLLSCRALGRGVEYQMTADCGRLALERNVSNVVFPFSPSSRNQPARSFLSGLIGDTDATSSRTQYRIPAKRAATVKPMYTAALPNLEFQRIPSRESSMVTTSSSHSDNTAALYKLIAEHYQTARSVLHAARGMTPELLSTAGTPAPSPSVEQTVSQMWSELLGRSIPSLDSDFFDLGGDSLKAIRVLSRIQKRFQVILPLALFFEGRITIAMLCSAIEEALNQTTEGSDVAPTTF